MTSKSELEKYAVNIYLTNLIDYFWKGRGTLRFWGLFWWSEEAVMLGGGVSYRTRCLILHKTEDLI